MKKIINFIKDKKDYFVWGATGALSFIFIFFIFSAFGIYFFGMKSNLFVRGAARIFPYPVARVGWDFILTPAYQKDINTLIRFYKFESDGSGLPVPGYEVISSSVLDRLIKNRVMEEMAHSLDIKITGEELDNKFLEMTSKMGSPEEVEEILDKMYGWSEKEFRKNIVRNILLQERIKEKLGTTVDLDAEIEKELEKSTVKIYIE